MTINDHQSLLIQVVDTDDCLRGVIDSNKATTDPSMHARLSSPDIYAYQPATPTLEKQLPGALSSFVGGLGRQATTNRALVT